jgi:hypothetical protein
VAGRCKLGSAVAAAAMLAALLPSNATVAPHARAALAPALSDSETVGIVQPDDTFAGKSYGEWSAAWWQWAASIPERKSPLVDGTGQNCDVDQSGPVWFLAGTTGGDAVRSCTVPAGKGILFPIINAECSTVEGDGPTEQQLRACAVGLMDHVTSARASVDDVKVDLGKPLAASPFRVQSPLFYITFVAHNPFGVKVGSGQAVADGFWVLLEPPPVGRHAVNFQGEAHFPGFTFRVKVRYDLTIEA